MLISVVVLAAGIALLGGLALIGTGGVTKPPSAVLEFIVPEEGRYVLVDHEFADVVASRYLALVGAFA